VLAVKPQAMEQALSEVAPLAQPHTVIVSIAAGVRLLKLESSFGEAQPAIRAMPNTPAQLGYGMTVAVANSQVSDDQRAAIDALFSAVGKVAWAEDEGLLDAVTAVSGSGPAYVFLLAECLAEAARRADLPPELAALLARETVAGAGALLAASPLPPATLRANVTSPGGTTAAALQILMAEDGLQQLVDRAVAAAKKRSIELG
jgi:pyrroline-5-carboxylate reductase